MTTKSEKATTEYERKRLENIKRNNELIASLNITSKLSKLSIRNHPGAKTKSYKLRSGTPHVIPDNSPRDLVPISMRDAIITSESDDSLVSNILRVSRLKEGSIGKNKRVMASVKFDSMELAPENVAGVVPNTITTVKLFPSADMTIVATGNTSGDVGFWNVNSEDKEGYGIYVYHPHLAYVSAIAIQPFSLNKIITSSHDGEVRSLDIEKGMFDLAYSTENAIHSMSQRLDDVYSLYFGEGCGIVHSWDERSRKTSFSWELHKDRINTIDFNSENVNMMATSSTDRTVCIWDLRKLGKSKPNSLKMITREKAVQSAYFSPSGSHLAITSNDAKIGVLSGVDYGDEFIINKYSRRSESHKWKCRFKGVWGWDDTHIFVGNPKGVVDVLSAEERRVVTTLESPHMTAAACHLDAHPLKPGMLAVAAAGVHRVNVWSNSW